MLAPQPSQKLNFMQSTAITPPHRLHCLIHSLFHSDIDIQGLVAHVDLFPAPNPNTGASSSTHPQNVSLTTSVFGSSFVHAVHMLDMTGQPVVFFVFAVSIICNSYPGRFNAIPCIITMKLLSSSFWATTLGPPLLAPNLVLFFCVIIIPNLISFALLTPSLSIRSFQDLSVRLEGL